MTFGEGFVEYFRDGSEHFDSSWNYRERALTIHVKAHVVPHTAGPYSFRGKTLANGERAERTMTVSAPSSSELRDFKEKFKQAVEDWWNGELKLVSRPNPSSRERVLQIDCGLRVDWVDSRDEAYLVMKGLFNPQGAHAWEFRENCALGGHTTHLGLNWRRGESWTSNPFDMVMTNEDVDGLMRRKRHCEEDTHTFDPDVCNGAGPWSQSHDRVFTQNTASHEFGHYLGCRHFCADSSSGTNAPDAYCRMRDEWMQQSIMAVGHEVRPREGTPWQTRFLEHMTGAYRYCTDREFLPEAPNATPEP